MKNVFTLALLGTSLTVLAQERSSISRSINDDGKVLHIKIDVEQSNRTIHYDRLFDINGMSKAEKESLISSIQDSLGVHVVVSPPRPQRVARAPRPPRYESGDVWASGKGTVNSTNSTWTKGPEEAAPKDVILSPEGTPYTKTVTEDPEHNRVKLKYEYKLDGQEHVFERTINLDGKTEADKQRIIADTERNLGLTPSRK